MVISVCKHCQRQYISRTKSYCCKKCKDIDYMRFEQIKVYLKNYPHSSAFQIAEALNFSVYVVLKYVEEGNLRFNDGSFEKLT